MFPMYDSAHLSYRAMKGLRLAAKLAVQVANAGLRAPGSSWNRVLARSLASHPGGHIQYPHRIGMREVVGFGMNGSPQYVDSCTFPYPAIRFREITPDFKALKEKEKGSWKILTTNEKKCLYRISFCKTLAEIDAPTGEWKKILGSTLLIISMALWFHLFILFMSEYANLSLLTLLNKVNLIFYSVQSSIHISFLAREGLPDSFKPENQVKQLKRMLDLKMNPIEGISSKWDYEANNWKGMGVKIDKKDKKDSKSKEN